MEETPSAVFCLNPDIIRIVCASLLKFTVSRNLFILILYTFGSFIGRSIFCSMRTLLLFICFISWLYTPGIFIAVDSPPTTPRVSFSEPQETTVYVTNSGEKYHKGTCQYLSKSKIKTTKAKAQKSGYTACKVCKP